MTSRHLVEECLEAAEHDADSRAAYLLLDADAARASADLADAARRAGDVASPFAGIPISIKDNFDVAGQVTKAGSTVLSDDSPASRDAASIAALRRAGFVFIGRTHMTEFAYSGLGLNAHYPDPACIWRDEGRRVPGGSSSGAAISVASGGALAGIGTDTGGSCRIPAAFNRLVGFKPTASRISHEGCVPLSHSLDSVGSIARSAECCAILDGLMAGAAPAQRASRSRRILVPTNLVLDGIDDDVAARFEHGLQRLARAGFEMKREHVPAFDLIGDITADGGLVAMEAYRHHRQLVADSPGRYDPRVLRRIMVGAGQPPERARELAAFRAAFVAEMSAALNGYACFAAPTVPVAPPTMADCVTEAGYSANNLLVLRNPSIANLMDGCSLTLPLPGDGPPAGMMLSAPNGQDGPLLSLAIAVEALL